MTIEQLTAELAELEKQFPVPDAEAIYEDCRWLESHWGAQSLASIAESMSPSSMDLWWVTRTMHYSSSSIFLDLYEFIHSGWS